MNLVTAMPAGRVRWLVLLFALWSLNAPGMGAGGYLDEAQEYVARGEYAAAVIQLKNALLANPDNVEARLLLGETYLKLEDGPAALKELARAQELGASREAVLQPLGRAYLMSGKADELLRVIMPEANDSPGTRVAILLLQAQAYLARQRYAMADEKFDKVLALQPDVAEALAGKARIALHEGDSAGAMAFADRAIEADSQTADAWLVKGELYRAAGEQRQAVSAFGKVLAIMPTSVPGGLGKAMSLVALGESDDALEQTGLLLKKYPKLYLAHYIRALALYQKQQPAQALEAAENALRLAPGHPESRRLAGTIQYQLGQLNQAEQNLRQYLRHRPDDRQVAKLLAATLLKLNEPDAAIEVLEPAVASASDDVQYLSLLAGAYLRQGNAAKGVEYLEMASALEPDSASIRTQLAIGYLARGEADQAIGELKAVVDVDEGLLQADLLLVMSYLRNGDYANALVVAESLKGKMPDSPVPYNLAGSAQFGLEDYEAARESYEKALQIQPDFLPAHLNLAQLDLSIHDSASAGKRYRTVLDLDAGNLKALLGLAALAQQEGQSAQAERWLKRAHQHHPEAIRPALLLVLHYRQQGQYRRALDLARETATKHPREAQVLKVLAVAQLQAGEDRAALATLRSLAEVQPQSPEVWYQLALAQIRLKKAVEAKESLQRALRLRGDYPAAQLVLGRLAIVAKDYEAAAGIADDLKKAHVDASVGYELEGDIHYARKEFGPAATAYATAAEKGAGAELTERLFYSYMKTGEPEAAYGVLRQWLATHPEDSGLRTTLAMALQAAGQQQRAIEEYLKVLEHDADNVTVLNNLAWLYQEAGNPAALKYAERAHELAPDKAEISDTLGWLLVHNGDINRGLLLLQEAVVRAPHIPDIRYHMIVALDRAGRREEARKELDRLLRTGKTFSELEKARALQRKWGG